MNISVDISLYPLDAGFSELVLDFIDRISGIEGIQVVRNTLSTQVFGDYKQVMALLESEMETSFAQLPHSIFVLKIIGTDRHPDVIDD
jgi:uncharacterized protein YqgV (UPF0045/DUF77 family)